MDFIDLLGKQLKDDSVIEIIEHYEIEVNYDFGRTNEGAEDVYWAPSQIHGFQFRFNSAQELDVIFLYVMENEGFTPILRDEIEVPVYDTFVEARNEFLASGLNFTNHPSEDPSDNWYQRWIKTNNGAYTIHYEFEDNSLKMITIELCGKNV